MVGRLAGLLVAVLFALAGIAGHAQAGEPAPKGRGGVSEWAKGNRILVGVTEERSAFWAQWRFQRSADGDIVLDLEEGRGAQMRAGSLMLISDAALLARDMPLERGRELDAFNGPLLMLQLVLRLLERAAPAGPASVKRETKVAASEASQPIKVAAMNAEGEFNAPWKLAGTIAPAAGGVVKFELEFSSASRAGAGAAYHTGIVGLWQNASPPVQLADAMPLRGWRVYRLKPAAAASGSANKPGLGTSAPMAFSNLAEVRSRVAQWQAESARRSRWQCS